MKKRKKKDQILNLITIIFSSFGIFILLAIISYVFINGIGSLSFDLLTSDYLEETLNVKRDDIKNYTLHGYTDPNNENEFFSDVWGIGLSDSKNIDGTEVVEITYLDDYSPIKNMLNAQTNEYVSFNSGMYIDKVVLTNENQDYIFALSNMGAEKMIEELDKGTIITDMITKSPGGGIRGSLLTTFYLIIITLIIALPLGVAGAIYLNEYAPDNKFTQTLRSLIDLIGGIPSIIFGFLGLFVFIPLCDNLFNSHGGSILSGALTLSVMLLPTIIRNTEETLKIIPPSFRSASYALGASKTQTIFKIILPNSISGILTSILLSVGRIIGESAALMFAIGTVIKDDILLTGNGTSLAVHIWVLMGGENPNFNTSCAIAIIILLFVFVLNFSIKIVAKKLNRFGV